MFEFNFLPDFVTPNIFLTLTLIYSILFSFFIQRKEKAFVELAFEQYLNKKLLNELKKSPNKLNLGGESKIVTTLFSDIRGFTSLSEKLKADELIAFLNKYLDSMSKIILEEEGTIDKFIGDGIMAFWNAPVEDINHAERSVRAALKMSETTLTFSNSFPTLPNIQVGIGINSGTVVVGNLGGSKRFDYTVIGDNVNLASRIEGLTKKYNCSVLVSEDTKELINSNEIKFREVDEVIVKGRYGSIRIYEPYIEHKDFYNVYEQAYDLYKKGYFREANELFNQNTDDPVSIIMAERCNFLAEFAPKEWVGVWTWDEK